MISEVDGLINIYDTNFMNYGNLGKALDHLPYLLCGCLGQFLLITHFHHHLGTNSHFLGAKCSNAASNAHSSTVPTVKPSNQWGSRVAFTAFAGAEFAHFSHGFGLWSFLGPSWLLPRLQGSVDSELGSGSCWGRNVAKVSLGRNWKSMLWTRPGAQRFNLA